MLKFLSIACKTRQERDISAYFELGTELFFLDFTVDTLEKAIQSKLFEQKTRVNIFLMYREESVLRSIAAMITYLYRNVFAEDRSKVNLYYPSYEICEYLNLQEVSYQWYNHFVNLWDEIPVDGLEKPMEYMYHSNSQLTVKQNEHFSLEVTIPKHFSFYYCGGNNLDIVDRAYAFDGIYYTLSTDRGLAREEYQELLHRTQNQSGLRSKFYLIPEEETLERDIAVSDGFRVITKEE